MKHKRKFRWLTLASLFVVALVALNILAASQAIAGSAIQAPPRAPLVLSSGQKAAILGAYNLLLDTWEYDVYLPVILK